MSEGTGVDVELAGVLGGFALDVAFAAPSRGITALFGRSGSGKTSVLRAIAGLQRLTGRVRLGGDIWQDKTRFVPPHLRPVGYVFQEASLFPHLSVRGNLRFGQRRALRGGAGEEVKLADIVEMLDLGRLLDRASATLSGGERQRVALGRALLSQPRLLLMDEPLSALDLGAREEILPYFETLHATLAIPALYVSHDLGEVTRLADHLVVLDAGLVRASGPLSEVLLRPDLPGIAGAARSAVVFAIVRSFDAEHQLSALDVAGETLLAVGRAGATGSTVRVRVSASDVSLARERPSPTTILNVLAVRIAAVTREDGGYAYLTLALGHGERGGAPTLLARISRRSLDTFAFAVGDTVFAQIKSVSLLTAPEPRRRAGR